MRRRRRLLPVILITALVCVVFLQLIALIKHNSHDGEDPKQMLFEVTLLQMNILNSSLNEAVKAEHTDELNELKLAAYTAKYTHDRFARTFAEGQLDELSGLSKLVAYITSLQIGGERSMTSEEQNVIHEAASVFSKMLPVYTDLLSSNDHIISSKEEELAIFAKELDTIVPKE
ncbi:hypothetical protein PASE110613_15805 [Paenibacillus sediminis]|uniref:S-adenosylmethionine decarboxylase n=1 Tax=Paenibacillus sediminis TaxID=664909 RepID=A0ABS4H7Q4_9BACL|nr:hypothetical protein [Paenibacillus sediminis]MBP1938302.1 hypothetical protein [Paenibacillus sediminis]